MGSSFAPVLAASVLIEFEKVVVTPLTRRHNNFYCRYVDDTLVLIKEDQIDKIFRLTHSTIIYGLL